MSIATIDTARRRLDDFLKILKRTKYLYVEISIPLELSKGYFEPTLLCFCWMDFLGGLYTGNPSPNSKGRITAWLKSPYMLKANTSYKTQAKKLFEGYRNGLVHGYAPEVFHLSYGDVLGHLTESGPGKVKIEIPTLIDHLIASVEEFGKQLQSLPLTKKGKPRPGSIEAFEQSFKQIFPSLSFP